MPHVEQELLTLPEHLCSPPVVRRVCVARSLVAYVMFFRTLLFCPFSFGHDMRRMSFEFRRLITSLVSSILMTYYYSNNVFLTVTPEFYVYQTFEIILIYGLFIYDDDSMIYASLWYINTFILPSTPALLVNF